MEEALRHSLAEKETLLREVHHRVKNNLAAIIGLLDLQRNLLTDAPTVSLLADLRGRIKSMALIHEMLYQSGTLSRVDFHPYLQALIGYLRSSFDPHHTVQFSVAATDIWMNLDTAIPCGLIVNELVINALKYAFPERLRCPGVNAGHIEVTATQQDSAYTLIVADNGVGLPTDVDWTTTKTLGLRLVRMLGQHQLQGQLELDRTAGTRIALRFNAH
jgi:two-component sensor histidine kinase